MTFHNNKRLKENRRSLRSHSTCAEKISWFRLRKKQIHNLRIHRQFSVGGYILDFYCPGYRLAIEVDGEYHNTLEQMEYDRIRTLFLNEHNIKVIRFLNEEIINDLENVLQRISFALENSPS